MNKSIRYEYIDDITIVRDDSIEYSDRFKKLYIALDVGCVECDGDVKIIGVYKHIEHAIDFLKQFKEAHNYSDHMYIIHESMVTIL